MAVLAGKAVADGYFATIELLGKPYDVYRLPSPGGIGPNIKALNNRVGYDAGFDEIVYVATAVGEYSGDAMSYSPTGGSSLLIPSDDRRPGELSRAEDISDAGVIIGWRQERDRGLPPRAFIFSNEDGLQYLGDLFPAVKALEETPYPPDEFGYPRGSQGLKINRDGLMIIESMPHGGGALYLVTADGSVSPLSLSECQRPDLNNFGKLPPPGGGGEGDCASVNLVINDDGAFAGGTPGPDGVSTLNGRTIPNSLNTGVTSINNFGYVGAGPDTIFTPDGNRVNLKAELLRQVPLEEHDEAWEGPGFSATYINDAGDISWANLFFTPACPSLSYTLSGTGFEFIDGKVSVRVGNRYTVNARVTNQGRGSVWNLSVERPPGPKLFRVVSVSTPGLPGELGPGESAEWTTELEAIGPGSYTGISVVRGESECGSVLVERPVATEFVGEPDRIVVNSVADRGRKPDADCCDTGELLPNGDPECTLRAAIEAVNADCGDFIEFNIPDSSGPSIAPTTPLPIILKPVILDATTQPGGGKVELVGLGIPGAKGLELTGGKSLVRGFVFNGFSGTNGVALRLADGGENEVLGNLFGTDVSGTVAQTDDFNLIIDNSAQNRIGGEAADEGNIFSARDAAIQIIGAASSDNRIEGNRIGLTANDAALTNSVGVFLTGGAKNVVGGAGARGNRVYSSGIGIWVYAAEPIAGTVIEGNHIGLNGAGQAPAKAPAGILVIGTADGPITNTRLVGNRVAGHVANVVLAGRNLRGTRVQDNHIGFAFADPNQLPGELGAGRHHYGLRIDGAPETVVTDNQIAGHDDDVIVAGNEQLSIYSEEETVYFDYSGPDDPIDGLPGGFNARGTILENNVVGLNASGAVPTGADSDRGISVFAGAEQITLRNNTVAGHTEMELWLIDGGVHTVAGNRLGTPDGVDRGSQRGLVVTAATNVFVGPAGIAPGNTIGRNAAAGVEVDGAAGNLVLRGNVIGADPGGNSAWPNGVGIRAIRAEEGESASGLVVADNTIAGNTGNGVDLDLPNLTVIRDNRIGVTPNGLALPNAIGVQLKDTPTELLRNTIAHNTTSGIDVEGNQPTRIESGPIYANGDGQASAGIGYETAPFPPPTRLFALRTPETSSQVSVVFGALTGGTAGEDEIEIYGNRTGETQGRVPLVRRTVPANRPYIERFDVNATSAFATADSFTATVTRGSRTSTFGVSVQALPFRFPEIQTLSVNDGELTLQWPAETGSFILETSPTPTGPWAEVPVTPIITEGVAEVTLAVGGSSRFYRLTLKI